MARLFDDTSSEYLSNTNTVVSAYPFAFVAWAYPDDSNHNHAILCMSDTDGETASYQLMYLRDDPDNDLFFFSDDDGCNTSNTYSANSWHHTCAIAASSTDRRVLLNNAGKGTDSTSEAFNAGIDNTTIGCRWWNSTQDIFASGRIAEAAVYNLSGYPGATDADKADNFENNVLPALADGFSPLCFPLGLTAYWPLVGRTSPEIDLVGGYGMTLNNTPGTADHPPIVYPSPAQFAVTAAAVGLSIPVAAYYYRMMRAGG